MDAAESIQSESTDQGQASDNMNMDVENILQKVDEGMLYVMRLRECTQLLVVLQFNCMSLFYARYIGTSFGNAYL